MAPLKFAAFSSHVELPFYTSLASLKINHDKLDDSVRRVLGLYEIRAGNDLPDSCRLQVHGDALTRDEVPNAFYRAEGVIKNVNTIEEYKAFDKAAFLKQGGRTIWDAIQDGSIFSCPSLLVSFCVVCYADLKKYKFTYHFGFPAIHPDLNWETQDGSNVADKDLEANRQPLGVHLRLSEEETAPLVDSVQTWRYSTDARQHGFFLAKRVFGQEAALENVEDTGPAGSYPPTSPISSLKFHWVVGALENYEKGFFETIPPEDQFICFADPSSYPTHPSWILRNLLVLLQHRWKLNEAQVLCYRDFPSRRHEARSLVLRIQTNNDPVNGRSSLRSGSESSIIPKITGWERNQAGKFASKVANLNEYLDPQRLADQAVDLNLKLIKWRIAPNIDLETVKNTACLLLGAGTLGSYVARNLMGWGVRKITFVDNGSVSFSNPVRQPLFNFQDCLAGGAKKALRAAEALREIYPGVESTGYDLSIPMAGHPIMDSNKVRTEFHTLKKLLDDHDAIFLLMDTRESRWLPTLMGRSSGKLVMNAALGFDTFVVMRHGVRNETDPSEELGCYFCNDIVAPADSLTDRTLDQQCTVTRPGIAAIASALLVEMMVSVLQHKDRALAPAPASSENTDSGAHPLGIVPHQIRGFLSSFQNIVTRGTSYKCCSACSPPILDAYAEGGYNFVEKALNERGYVEEVSGLAEVQRAAESAASQIDFDADSDSGIIDSDGELI